MAGHKKVYYFSSGRLDQLDVKNGFTKKKKKKKKEKKITDSID